MEIAGDGSLLNERSIGSAEDGVIGIGAAMGVVTCFGAGIATGVGRAAVCCAWSCGGGDGSRALSGDPAE